MAGRYRLAESIGQGGMGRVWRAVDAVLDRQVAVKEMRIDGLGSEDTRTRRERTLREARATARIDHPNVVRVYDVVDEGDRLWIVMELVAGRSLEGIMAEDGPLSPLDTARIGLGLVTALREVHSRGVLHRDIKPGNVLVESRAPAGSGQGPERRGPGGRRIVLTDFGIAAIQDTKALTMVGMLVGSPDYMAPERVSGRPQGPPSDVWSLGATLCAALTGHSPFARDTTPATLHAVLYEEPELPVGAGPLRAVLAVLLEKDPAARPTLPALESLLAPIAFPRPTPTLAAGAPPPPSGTSPARAQAVTERRSVPDGHTAPAPDAPRAERAAERTRGRTRQPHEPAQAQRHGQGQGGGQDHEQGQTPGRAGRRRTGLFAALGVAAVGAVVAVVLATIPGARDGADRAGGGASGPSAATPTPTAATATAAATANGSGSAAHSPPGSGSASPTVQGTFRPPSPPPGAHREAGGYAWVTPKGWRRDVKTGSEVHYTSPDGAQELVAKSSLAHGDLMDAWRTSEENARQGRDYRKIRLAETTFRGRPAVVWEYTFTLRGDPWHARLLGFDESGKSYQVNTWYRPGREAEALQTYEAVKGSFTVM
ncbi:tRNA A-37 threonylcarbamoyl transferase component Bud32 [Streptomyces achromogenes]|uniref:non-specific serine/threonine protein kinase n=1 Tax=Streptomyces achromogenes TaxID=67255 RepID=A0ABU0PZW8_STRAH|nr:serine/threonine protein kinase [Streptomyces achromogenes]MDQ0683879.1 tRNA A-37 threonylcarbamoyl transferase component Bud32 [Streptomyces achromogenes]